MDKGVTLNIDTRSHESVAVTLSFCKAAERVRSSKLQSVQSSGDSPMAEECYISEDVCNVEILGC